MDDLLGRVERHIREHDLIPAGGRITCLVSGGADSTCLWHALGVLGYAVSAVHVDHGLRGEENSQAREGGCPLHGQELTTLARGSNKVLARVLLQ